MTEIYYVTAPSGWHCMRVTDKDGFLIVTLLDKEGGDFGSVIGIPVAEINTIEKLRSFIAEQMPGFGLVKDG